MRLKTERAGKWNQIIAVRGKKRKMKMNARRRGKKETVQRHAIHLRPKQQSTGTLKFLFIYFSSLLTIFKEKKFT
jgi:hypothetical protein